jgi:hypothetical protein
MPWSYGGKQPDRSRTTQSGTRRTRVHSAPPCTPRPGRPRAAPGPGPSGYSGAHVPMSVLAQPQAWLAWPSSLGCQQPEGPCGLISVRTFQARNKKGLSLADFSVGALAASGWGGLHSGWEIWRLGAPQAPARSGLLLGQKAGPENQCDTKLRK